MHILIIGCGWVGTYTAARFLADGHRVWGTTTTQEKSARLAAMGIQPVIADFDQDRAAMPATALTTLTFDLVIISVPITRKDTLQLASARFTNLICFLDALHFSQSVFFGSVGIYPKVSATIDEDTFAAKDLDQKLLLGETLLRKRYAALNILRLGGLFGLDRTLSKYFQGKICEIGYQPANFVHVADIDGVIRALLVSQAQGKTYNMVCPQHPLKKDVIAASAAKYGYALPAGYTDTDQTAKIVSPGRLIHELGYQFIYP